MNYLTHFLIDGKQDRPYYNFGLILPDMVGVAKRGWKPAHTEALEASTGNTKEIWLGYQQHIARDALFHNTHLFSYNTKRIRKELEQAGLAQEGVRLFFVAHVLLEILIDRHIIKTRRYVADRFYDTLAQIEEPEIRTFFDASGTEMPERFLEFFGKFQTSRYLYGYADDDGIYFSINRLLHRTKQTTYETEANKKALGELVQREERTLFDEIEQLLET